LDDEEEVLMALAQVLGDFLDKVGGPAHTMSLLQPLESLCAVEEAAARDQATEGIKKILASIKVKDFEGDVMSMIQRLMSGENFTSKFTGTQLIPHLFQHVSSQNQAELMTLFTNASKDEVPQVRKTAATVLNDMIKLVPKVPESEMLKIFNTLIKDDQDSVRMQCIDCSVSLAKVLPAAKVNQYLLPDIKLFAQDKSWRIRYLVADRIMEIANSIGFEYTKDALLPYYCNFLADSESEVRTAAVRRIADFCQILDKPTIEAKILPTLKKL